MFSRALVIGVVAAGALLMAPVTSAAVKLHQTGTVGVYSLTDTSSSPGVTGLYKELRSGDAVKLYRIKVRPPKVKAAAGHGSEMVGWQFVIQRRRCDLEEPCTPWSKDYASPVFAVVTDSTHDAPFSWESVGVKLPCSYVSGLGGGCALYRANVELFWFDNGRVIGSVTYRISWYAGIEGSKIVYLNHYLYDYY